MAGFNNPLTGYTALRKPAIESPNYSAGSAGWTINQDGSAEFNNGTFRGTVTASVFEGTDYIQNSSGTFYYSGTPALGNLIASIAPAAGTDGFGNHYVSGFAVYSAGALVARIDPAGGVTSFSSSGYVSMSPAAGVFFGAYNPNTGTLLPSGAQVTETPDVGLPSDQGTLDIYSPLGAGGNKLVHRLWSGYDSVGTGSPTAPHLLTVDNDASSPADHYISGNVAKTSLDGTTPFTWVSPSLNAGFVNDNCQYIETADGALRWQGEITVSAAQGAAGALTIFTLPAGIRPLKEVIVPASWRNSGGLSKGGNAFFAFETTGVVMVGFSGATTANDRFSCAVELGIASIA